MTTDISDPRTVGIGSLFGTFPTAMHSVISVMPSPRSLAVADFNGDGKEDLATGGGPGSGNPGSIWVLLGNGAGAFTTAPGSPFTTGPDPLGLAAADLDGDGFVDLAAVDDDTNTL